MFAAAILSELNPDASLPAKILYFLFFPLIYLFVWNLARYHDKRDGYRRETPKPLPLKSPRNKLGFRSRRRSISQKHVTQSASARLLTLPREIRDMIWAQLFPHMKVHLYIEDRKLRGFRCDVNNERDGLRDCVNRCWIYDSQFEVNRGERTTEKLRGVGVMGLLQSCRQIYKETIHLLYATTTFLPDTPDTLAYLPTLFLPQHLALVPHLRFHWRLHLPPSHSLVRRAFTRIDIEDKKPNFYRDTWTMIWATLSSMQGLQTVTIELNVSERREQMWKVKDLEIVKSVTRPESVVIVLGGIMYDTMVGKVGGSNCRVVHR